MATRIEKPVVGETYWDKDGDPCTVLFVYDRHATGYWTEKGKNYGMTWYAGKENERWPLFATDPTKPEPIDLTRKWKFRSGEKVTVKKSGTNGLYVESIDGHRWCYSGLDGKHFPNSKYDLVPDDDLPALDLTKPVKFARGGRPAEVKLQNGLIYFKTDAGSAFDSCNVDGTQIGIPVLVQCTRRDWTQADVPFPRPTFRIIDRNSTNYEYEVFYVAIDGIRMSSTSFVSWPELASDWEYTTDGKTWNRCEVYE